MDTRLGRGGMGEVWRGFDLQLGRAVAVKLLLEFDAREELLQRFRREASIGARLQHPGITVVHDVGHHEQRLFIVMELLEGADLAAVLGRSPAGLPVADAVGLALQAAESLAAAHAGKVVHRDLKPGNLFLLANGRLKICDFGIAHTAEATGGLTATGQVFGTPAYMAPEQWRGEHVDAPCDLYALGCVLHELLSGAPPFPTTQQPWALMHRHLEEAPTSLRSLREDIPPALADLVASLLAKDPAARPDAPTTAQFLHALQHPAPAPGLHFSPTQTQLPSPGPGPAQGQDTPATPVPTPTEHDIAPAAAPTPRGPRRRSIIVGSFTALAVSGGAITALRLADGNGSAGSDGSAASHGSAAPHAWYVLTGHTAAVNSVAFSPDGKTLASASVDHTIRLWDLASRASTATLTGHTDGVYRVAFSPDGKTLASGSADHTIRLWDLVTRASIATLTNSGSARAGIVSSVAFSPNGKTLASGDGNGEIRLWDLTTRTSTATLTGHTNSVSSVAFSPDGTTLASCGDTTIRLWDLATRTSTATLNGHTTYVVSVAFRPDGKTLASGSADATVRLWDLATGTTTAKLANPAGTKWENPDHFFVGAVNSVVFSPDGKTLATASGDPSDVNAPSSLVAASNTVRLWGVATLTNTATLTASAPAAAVYSVAFSPDGKTLASAGDDHIVRLWKLS